MIRNDLNLDGAVELSGHFVTVEGTWQLNDLGFGASSLGSTVLGALGEESVDLLVTSRLRSVFIAELGSLDYLDDPTGVNPDGIVSLDAANSLPRHLSPTCAIRT